MTLHRVARRAGVSSATVSRVLNNAGGVKDATRARVLNAVRELDYHPNIHASTLARGRSRTLGMIVSNLKNPFFLDIFQALEGDAHERGFEVVVANTDYQPKQLLTHVRLMLGRRLAGLAVIVSEMESTLTESLVDAQMPVVFYDVGVAGPRSTKVRTDYARGTRRVVEYLHSLGHRNMAFVGHHTALEPLQIRQHSFVEAVRTCPGARYETVADEDSPRGGLQATRTLLASGFDPTAIVCINDFMALGVIKGLREVGRAIPSDVSVVGCDNISMSEFACPPLTTVDIPTARIAHIMAEALMPDGDESPLHGRELVVEPELIIRDSTGLAPPANLAHARMTGGR